jgi:phosphoribosyl 1,2-cyclic phosphodiesterase
MTLTATILGCGSSTGVPRVGLGWGDADPNNPKNRRRRCSLLVERRNAAGGRTCVLVDTSPDLREQLLDANVEWLDAVLYTHEHADHTHGIDDLRPLTLKRRRRVDVYADLARTQCAVRLLLRDARRQRISADSVRAPARSRAAGHDRRRRRHDRRAAVPPGAWRHAVARVPLRQLGLLGRRKRGGG